MSRSRSQPILWVDGYNIIGDWPDLKRLRDGDSLESARMELTEVLVNYSAFKGLQTHLVFDAYAQTSTAAREQITPNLRIHYTDFGQTADTYIEKACAQFFKKDVRKFHTRLIVATSDRAHQLTVVGYGAEWISAQQLAMDVKETDLQVKQRQQAKKSSSGRTWFNALDPNVQEHLAKMRLGFHPQPHKFRKR